MQKTSRSARPYIDRGAITSDELQQFLGCGRKTATEIGAAAGARIQIGTRRVLWNVARIQEYLDSVSGC